MDQIFPAVLAAVAGAVGGAVKDALSPAPSGQTVVRETVTIKESREASPRSLPASTKYGAGSSLPLVRPLNHGVVVNSGFFVGYDDVAFRIKLPATGTLSGLALALMAGSSAMKVSVHRDSGAGIGDPAASGRGNPATPLLFDTPIDVSVGDWVWVVLGSTVQGEVWASYSTVETWGSVPYVASLASEPHVLTKHGDVWQTSWAGSGRPPAVLCLYQEVHDDLN